MVCHAIAAVPVRLASIRHVTAKPNAKGSRKSGERRMAARRFRMMAMDHVARPRGKRHGITIACFR